MQNLVLDSQACPSLLRDGRLFVPSQLCATRSHPSVQLDSAQAAEGAGAALDEVIHPGDVVEAVSRQKVCVSVLVPGLGWAGLGWVGLD